MLLTYPIHLYGNGLFTATFSVKPAVSAMDKGGPAKTKGIYGFYYNCNIICHTAIQLCCGVNLWICFTDDKPEVKDLRSNPPTKVKLPTLHRPSPPPVKDKPNKLLAK